MVCIHCGSKTSVINSRQQTRSNSVWRRRQCINCKSIFTTEENPLYSATWLVKDLNGKLTAFSRDKLYLSLFNSCLHRHEAYKDSTALVATLISKLPVNIVNGTLESSKIRQTAIICLNRFDKTAAMQYIAFNK